MTYVILDMDVDETKVSIDVIVGFLATVEGVESVSVESVVR